MSKEEYEEYLDETDLDEEDLEEDYEEDYEEDHNTTDNTAKQDSFEDAKEFYRRDNGNRFLNPSRIFGTITGLVAVAAHIIHTFVSNVLFGKYEQLAIREAFMRGLGKIGEPGEISTDECKKKEGPKQKETAKETEALTKQHIIKKADIPNHASQKPSYPLKNNEIEVLRDMFNNPHVQHVFALNGYLSDAIPGKDKAYFFEYHDGKVNGISRGFQASEFYTGNVNGMSHAVQEIDHSSPLEAAFKSCALRSAVIFLTSSGQVRESLVDGVLATADIKTPYGSDTVSFVLNEEHIDQVNVLYNGLQISTIPSERLYKEPFQNYKEPLLDFVHSFTTYELNLSDDMTVSWDNQKNELTINKGKTALGPFSFTSGKDIQSLTDALKANDVCLLHKKGEEYIPIQPEALSYTLAILTNPDMKIARSEDGMCINPITHTTEPDGKSHLYTVHHEGGVELHAYLPSQVGSDKDFQLCSFTSRNQVCERAVYEIAACIQETSHILDQIPDIDESYKRQTVKETEITAFVPEKDELTSELFHGLYDKCRQEIGFGDTVIPATIPLDQVMEELNMIFKTDIDNESELSENKVKSKQFHNNSIALSGDPDYNTIKESEEDLIENTSLFVPAYDEEER